MAFGLLLPFRILQGVFALIVLSLSGYVARWYNEDTLTASPGQINFLIFLPCFSFFSIAYLEITPRFLSKLSHPIAHFTLEILNTLFYFAGFIALSTFLAKLLFCRGSVCAAARADAVFAAFGWVQWTGSAALLGFEMMKGRGSAAVGDDRVGVKSNGGGMKAWVGNIKGLRTDKNAKSAMREAKGNSPV